jgi:hypothetical protein
MKEKLSVTIDAALVGFLDALPGPSRSAKLEAVLRRFKRVVDDQRLRRSLAKARASDAETREHDAWIRTMEHDVWSAFDEETSGPSSS